MGKIRDRMNERRLKRTLQRIRNETDKIPTDGKLFIPLIPTLDK